MRQVRNTAVIEALSEAVRNFGIKKLAPELDKEPSSLYGELNPYGDQGKGKLGFDDALEAMRVINNFKALELAAASLGFALVPMECMPDKPTLSEEIADTVASMSHLIEACTSPNPSETAIICATADVVSELKQLGKIAVHGTA